MARKNKAICDICGKECDSFLMREYSTGRRTHRVCADCQDQGKKQFASVVNRPNRLARKSRFEK